MSDEWARAISRIGNAATMSARVKDYVGVAAWLAGP